jgi:glycine/D-amino acid oxidase-like deaminating enzyme
MTARVPIPLREVGPGLRFLRQAQFHPLRYLNGLAAAIERKGGRIHTGTHAESVAGSGPLQVRTSNGFSVTAHAVVMATNSPVWDNSGLFTSQSAYRTYVIGARVAAGSVPAALFWDTSDPYHYVRLRRGADNGAGDLLLVGGEDHKTGQAQDFGELFSRLEAWTRERFPIRTVETSWSGQVLEPVDGMAYIGRNPFSSGNLYVATGDSGNGMTHGAIAGMLLADLIQGRFNDWAGLYDPARVNARAAAGYAEENLNALSQYADWITEADIDSRDRLAPDSGATIAGLPGKIAVYRDPGGKFHERSAVCPHLGCIVSWNDAEKSWDCPCHGSRFDPYGRVLNGPANRNLAAPESYRPLLSAAGVGLRAGAGLGANFFRRFLTLGIRTGS